MTAPAASWRFERLSAGAREAAEAAALGAGKSLSDWLTSLIGDACTAEGVAPPRETPTVLAFARESAQPDPDFAAQAAEEPAPTRQAVIAGAAMLPIASIVPADLGTRRDDSTPDTLISDVAKRGVRQPLLVRRVAGADGRYELICGHRRWRAAQRAGLTQVPAAVCSYDDGQAILASLTENIVLGDLSPIEEAHAYLSLLTRCAIDTSAIAQASGRDRQRIVRSLRLLGLPARVRQLIGTGAITAELADLLLDATNPEALADAIVAEHLNLEAARQRVGVASNRESAS